MVSAPISAGGVRKLIQRSVIAGSGGRLSDCAVKARRGGGAAGFPLSAAPRQLVGGRVFYRAAAWRGSSLARPLRAPRQTQQRPRPKTTGAAASCRPGGLQSCVRESDTNKGEGVAAVITAGESSKSELAGAWSGSRRRTRRLLPLPSGMVAGMDRPRVRLPSAEHPHADFPANTRHG